MAKSTKVKINDLARELGVASKVILEKLRAEGLGEQAKNHMCQIPLGLAESVREWFHAAGHEVATAVETAAPVEVASTKKPRVRKKTIKKDQSLTEEGGAVAVMEAPPETIEAPPAPPAVEEAEPQVAPPAPEVMPVETPVISAPAVPPVAPPAPAATPVAEVPAVAPAVPADAPPAPAAAPAAPAKPAKAPKAAPKPTVSVKRPAITPAPRLVSLEPAKIQGPRVVRVEKEETIDIRGPRPARPTGDRGGITPAGPRGGRGVRTTSDDEEEDRKKKAAKAGANRTLSSRRRGLDGRRGEAMEKLKEFSNADLLERQERLAGATSYRTGFDSHLRKRAEKGQHGPSKTIVQKGEPVEIEEPITVRNLAVALGIKANDIIGRLMRQGVFATLNESLDADVAGAMALEYGIELQIKQQRTLEEQLIEEFDQRRSAPEKLVPRPPVVTILGHVDHGKTSLLDKIRHANVAAGEAGGITQHTAAWMVELDGADGRKRRVTFIDTPGHQAFTAMRARGANMTDVVVLVVSAAEGVQPQTVESINHARAAEVPIVVAMNKIDRPDANPDMVLGQLAKEGLNPVEWGGDTEVVRTSAVTGQGVNDLIEVLDYQAALLELKADPTAPAAGMVIESRMDEGLGAVATVLVQDGSLRVGDLVLSGPGYGRIRNLRNDRGESIQEAGPATPVIVSGLDELPNAGDRFYVVDDLERVRAIAEERQRLARQAQLAGRNQVTADSLLQRMDEQDTQTINLIIKADVQGSIETLTRAIPEASSEEIRLRIIHSGVGGISESDVQLAMATKAKPTDNKVAIIGFHVVPDESARALAEQNHIDIKLYRVIYEIFDDLKKAMSGMLKPEEREKLHGHAEVRQVFKVSRVGSIAGCMVSDGHISRGSKIRLIRDGVVITEGLSIESLRRVKDDVREVKSGFECGIKLAGYDDIKVGDRFEAYVREMIERTL